MVGDKKLTCGGYLAMDLYLTGHKPLIPPKLAAEHDDSADNSPGLQEKVDHLGVVFILTLNGRALQQVKLFICCHTGYRT